jgi:hypothetical protein
MRASDDNVALRKAIADNLRAEAPEVARQLDRQNEPVAASPGAFVPGGEQIFTIERFDGAHSPTQSHLDQRLSLC